jgi:predicted NAD/FAD-binding protein
MKIAIVGSGIAGLYAAHYLSKHHQVMIYFEQTPSGHDL